VNYTSRRYARRNRWDPSHVRTVNRLLAPAPGARLLEVGCGRGFLARALQAQGLDVVGVDANPHAIETGVASGLHTMRAEALDLAGGSFDGLYSFHAIEHVPPVAQALAEMARVLRPGGKLLLVYPAEPIQGLYAVPTSLLLYGTPWRARDIHCHKLTPSRLRALAAPLPLDHMHSEFMLFRSPQFATVFERR
jgi:SAM-dependent methyltransferase